MTKRQRRMAAVASLLVGLSAAAALGVTAFRKNMMYFYTPSDLVTGSAPAGAKLRLGGLVERGSVQRGADLLVKFTLSDCEKSVPVQYRGILPDLFREGQGIVATGAMGGDGVFTADEVLAKHDENYMPPQLASSLKTADGKHSCMPFKRVSDASQKPPLAEADVPRPALRAEGRASGGAVGGVRAARSADVKVT
ncbi:MAG TPA: cytochrome c maturation protein CcmE [Nevskiaceae bacterium]|nr:cytochrome c maturation protein CcmE [Nevskiaceae bacterium]